MSLCKDCKNCMRVEIKNNSGGSGNITKVICLINEWIFKSLVSGCYNKEYPKITECSKYEKYWTREEYIAEREKILGEVAGYNESWFKRVKNIICCFVAIAVDL